MSIVTNNSKLGLFKLNVIRLSCHLCSPEVNAERLYIQEKIKVDVKLSQKQCGIGSGTLGIFSGADQSWFQHYLDACSSLS